MSVVWAGAADVISSVWLLHRWDHSLLSAPVGQLPVPSEPRRVGIKQLQPHGGRENSLGCGVAQAWVDSSVMFCTSYTALESHLSLSLSFLTYKWRKTISTVSQMTQVKRKGKSNSKLLSNTGDIVSHNWKKKKNPEIGLQA